MDGHQAAARDRPTYDAPAVDFCFLFIFYLITHSFRERPHTGHTEVEETAVLLTELDIVMRTIFSINGRC